jgi:hypothetical protein
MPDSGIIFGKYGWEKGITSTATVNPTTAKGRQLGARMQLPDGRSFVWCKAAGTIGAGKLVAQDPTSTTYDNALVVPTARAIGDTVVTVTNAAATLAVDTFNEGYLHIESSTGLGYDYKIKAQAAATTTGAISLTLAESDSIRIALATSSRAGLRRHPDDDVVIWPTTATGVPIGVTKVAVSSGDYFWAQTYGLCALLSDAVVWRTGAPIKPSFSVAGAARDANPVAGTASTTSGSKAVIGWAPDISVSAEYQMAFLTIGR